MDGKRKLILNAHLYKLGVQIKQVECTVNFSDRYWKHPCSEICYPVRIEFIHIATCERGIKELHLLRKCKLSTQSISPFSCPSLYVELLLSSALSPDVLLTHESKTCVGTLSLTREKIIFLWYSRTLETCIFINIAFSPN